MNYYEKELKRLEGNFEFSMKIYEKRPLLQGALCIEMMGKVERLRIPTNYSELYLVRKNLYDKIKKVYQELPNGRKEWEKELEVLNGE